MIELKNIGVSYKNNGTVTEVLKNVSTVINKGDIVAIIGPSGTGKSTLLNCINLLCKPTSGQVFFEGNELTNSGCNLNEVRKKVGMVFQQFNLFGNMTVLENAVIPQIQLLGRDKKTACDNAMKYLRLVGMADKKFSYPDQLSGGQKQRAAIARTLSMDPDVILLDEPTSALDPTMVGEVEFVIKKLAKLNRTMVIVTHEMRFAKEISNRVFYMDEGGIYEDGPSDKIFSNPERPKTKMFINKLKCLEIEVASKDSDYIEAITKIKNFGEKFDLGKDITSKAQLLFEEACIQKILPCLGDSPKLKAVFAYSMEDDKLTLNIYHDGEKTLDLENDEDFSGKIISSISKVIPVTETII